MTPLNESHKCRPTLSNVFQLFTLENTYLLEPSDDDAARLAQLQKLRDTTASLDAALTAIKIRLKRELGNSP